MGIREGRYNLSSHFQVGKKCCGGVRLDISLGASSVVDRKVGSWSTSPLIDLRELWSGVEIQGRREVVFGHDRKARYGEGPRIVRC